MWSSLKVALHFKSSKSQILTVLSSDPEARYSCWNGFKDKHMTASVWVPMSSLLYFLTMSALPDLKFSLFYKSPKIAVGSTDSESKFQISISGKNVPTMTWFVGFESHLLSHSKQSGYEPNIISWWTYKSPFLWS